MARAPTSRSAATRRPASSNWLPSPKTETTPAASATAASSPARRSGIPTASPSGSSCTAPGWSTRSAARGGWSRAAHRRAPPSPTTTSSRIPTTPAAAGTASPIISTSSCARCSTAWRRCWRRSRPAASPTRSSSHPRTPCSRPAGASATSPSTPPTAATRGPRRATGCARSRSPPSTRSSVVEQSQPACRVLAVEDDAGRLRRAGAHRRLVDDAAQPSFAPRALEQRRPPRAARAAVLSQPADVVQHPLLLHLPVGERGVGALVIDHVQRVVLGVGAGDADVVEALAVAPDVAERVVEGGRLEAVAQRRLDAVLDADVVRALDEAAADARVLARRQVGDAAARLAEAHA